MIKLNSLFSQTIQYVVIEDCKRRRGPWNLVSAINPIFGCKQQEHLPTEVEEDLGKDIRCFGALNRGQRLGCYSARAMLKVSLDSASTVRHWNIWCFSMATPEDSEVRVSILLNNSSCKTPWYWFFVSFIGLPSPLLKGNIFCVLNLKQKEESQSPAPFYPLIFCHFKASITLTSNTSPDSLNCYLLTIFNKMSP